MNVLIRKAKTNSWLNTWTIPFLLDPSTLHSPPCQDEPSSVRGCLLVMSPDFLQTKPPSQVRRGVETLSEEMWISIPENQSQSSYLELLSQARADLLQVTRHQREDELLVFHFLTMQITCSNFQSEVWGSSWQKRAVACVSRDEQLTISVPVPESADI